LKKREKEIENYAVVDADDVGRGTSEKFRKIKN
jgi:hypothetical protein